MSTHGTICVDIVANQVFLKSLAYHFGLLSGGVDHVTRVQKLHLPQYLDLTSYAWLHRAVIELLMTGLPSPNRTAWPPSAAHNHPSLVNHDCIGGVLGTIHFDRLCALSLATLHLFMKS